MSNDVTMDGSAADRSLCYSYENPSSNQACLSSFRRMPQHKQVLHIGRSNTVSSYCTGYFLVFEAHVLRDVQVSSMTCGW
jgi:hypothetical protein